MPLALEAFDSTSCVGAMRRVAAAHAAAGQVLVAASPQPRRR